MVLEGYSGTVVARRLVDDAGIVDDSNGSCCAVAGGYGDEGDLGGEVLFARCRSPAGTLGTDPPPMSDTLEESLGGTIALAVCELAGRGGLRRMPGIDGTPRICPSSRPGGGGGW